MRRAGLQTNLSAKRSVETRTVGADGSHEQAGVHAAHADQQATDGGLGHRWVAQDVACAYD